MNPAGLKVHLSDLKDNGMLIINTANFTPKNLKLAGYDENPMDNDSINDYQLIKVDMTKLVETALKDSGLSVLALVISSEKEKFNGPTAVNQSTLTPKADLILFDSSILSS